jgi:hypothetical protein
MHGLIYTWNLKNKIREREREQNRGYQAKGGGDRKKKKQI